MNNTLENSFVEIDNLSIKYYLGEDATYNATVNLNKFGNTIAVIKCSSLLFGQSINEEVIPASNYSEENEYITINQPHFSAYGTVYEKTGDITPPSTIHNLNHETESFWILWKWTKLFEPDFNHTEIYLNGIFITNISAPQNYYNATGLTPNTQYAISTRTVDTSGNINLTWVNDTATTLPAPCANPPIITIISPVNETTYNIDSVNLNYSVNEPTTWQGYSLDGSANITLHENTTLTGLTDGLHTLTVYANDTSGNMNSSTVWFAIDTTPPAINTVTLNTTTPTPGEDILVTVNTTDNIAVTNVTTNGIALIQQGGNIWNGTITAIDGTHSVNASASDAAGNIGWNNSTRYTATTPDTTPPSSITNITPTAGTTYLNWTWTNPPDPDFNHTEIYLNGTFQTITSSEHFNATSLTADTEYTISTRTVDTAGNINQTWVNDTATTLPISIHDINISTDYAPETNGIKIEHDGALIDGDNLTIGDTYEIYYKIVNDGDHNESVNVTTTARNATWNQTIASHDWNIKSGEYRYPSGGDSWNTTGLSQGIYNITINASIPIDINPSNNERTRQIMLIPAKDTSPL